VSTADADVCWARARDGWCCGKTGLRGVGGVWVFDGHLVMTHDEGLEESRDPYRDHCCQSASNDAALNPRRAVESLQEAILNQGKGNAVSTLTWRAASSTGELLNSMFQSGDIGDRYASRG